MKISILIPHFKNGKVTAYAVSQLLKYKGNHEIDIIVIDNLPDGSADYLKPFLEDILIVEYPKDRLSSHGIAFDFILEKDIIKSEYFICMESDSFPTNSTWLDYYEKLINEGYDCAGSLLKLSAGEYLHPCCAIYSKKLWNEAKEYCGTIAYSYIPNFGNKEGFDCHLMIRLDKAMQVFENPDDYFEVGNSYKGLTVKEIIAKERHYSPVVNPFHNGMGNFQESINTYGWRDIEYGKKDAILDYKSPIIFRIGEEPGQWLSYFAEATSKKIKYIKTDVIWMNGKENSQQEYSKNECGMTHIWAGTAYLDMKNTSQHDVYEFKKNQIEQLYNSLPEHQKIKI